ncbi:hypothetical protein D3C80_809590 [compost metagenome]
MRLSAEQPALAEHATGTDGRLGLDNVPASAERIAFRVEEGQHALLLIVVHDEEPHRHRHRYCSGDHTDNPAPAQPPHEQHEGARGENQQRRTQIRLAHDEDERHANHDQADHYMLEVRRQRALGQVPGDGRRHDDLHELRGLEADHPGNVDPARGAHGVMAHDIHHHQQNHPADIGQGHPARHETRFQLGDDEHRHQADAEGAGLLEQQVPILATGRIEDEQATGRQGQQQNQQRTVDMDALQETGAAAHHILAGEHAIEITHHGAGSWTMDGLANSGLRRPSGPSNQASMT